MSSDTNNRYSRIQGNLKRIYGIGRSTLHVIKVNGGKMLDYVKIAGGNLKTAKTGERPEMENTHYIRDSYRNMPGMHHYRVKFFMKKLNTFTKE